MNWDSLFKTINTKIKDAEELRNTYYKANDFPTYNHWVGYLQALFEMKDILRKRKSRSLQGKVN